MQGLNRDSWELYAVGASALGALLGLHPLVPLPPFYTWFMVAPLTIGGILFAVSLLRQKRHPAVAFATTAAFGLVVFGVTFGVMRAIIAIVSRPIIIEF